MASYNDYPQAATNNAKRALKWRDDTGNPKDCGTRVGWTRANQLANREPISRDTIARMSSFARHEQYKNVPYEEGCGGLVWDLWGGDEGISWAKRKLKEIDSNMIEEIQLIGEVGGWNYWTTEEVKNKFLNTTSTDIKLIIASEGGSVFDGMEIAAMMRQSSANVRAVGLGFVASIATVIMAAANESAMDEFGFYLIHNPFGGAVGEAEDMRRYASQLQVIQDAILDIYTNKIASNGKLIEGDMEKTRNKVRNMMKKETILTAQQAFEMGFIDELLDEGEETIQIQPDNVSDIQDAFNGMRESIMNNSSLKQTIKNQILMSDKKKGLFGWVKAAFTTEEPKDQAPTTEDDAATVQPIVEELTEEQMIEKLEAKGYEVLSSDQSTEIQDTLNKVKLERDELKAKLLASANKGETPKAKKDPKASAKRNIDNALSANTLKALQGVKERLGK